MKKVSTALWALFILLLIPACSDFFEKDVSNSMVELVSPPDTFKTSTLTVTFSWNQENGAERYNLQVVQPGFDRIERLVIDSVTEGNLFTTTLSPGTFEWRVFALNSSSISEAARVRSLVIDSTLSLSNQKLILVSPSDNHNTDQTKLMLKWDKLSIANDYLVEIRRNSWAGEQAFGPVVTKSDTVSLELPEGKYFWGVQARNENTSSDFFVRNFIIDTTPPGIPKLLLPPMNDTITENQVVFSWEHPKSSLSMIQDSVVIASDSLFQDVVYNRLVADTTNRLTLSPAEHGLNSGKYFWRMRSRDKAGNSSADYSGIRIFFLEDEE